MNIRHPAPTYSWRPLRVTAPARHSRALHSWCCIRSGACIYRPRLWPPMSGRPWWRSTSGRTCSNGTPRLKLPAAASSTLRRPQPGPSRVRDPSRSRLKPEDQQPQVMIRTCTSVGPEALGPRAGSLWRGLGAWTRAWPSLWSWPWLTWRLDSDRGSGSELAASDWPWLRVKAVIRLSLESEPLACLATVTITKCLCTKWYTAISGDILRYIVDFQPFWFFLRYIKHTQIYHRILRYVYYLQDILFHSRYRYIWWDMWSNILFNEISE